MVQVLLFLLFAILLINNFNKGVIAIVILHTWLSCFSLWNQTMTNYLSIVIFILFFINYGTKGLNNIKKFPLKFPFFLMAFSLFISDIMAVTKHTPTMIISIISNLFIIYIFWYILNNETCITIKRFLKYTFIYAIFVGFYTLFETITQTNPIVEYFNSIDAYSYERIITEIRYGIKRSQSIFSMHTTNGAVSLILFIFCYFAYKYKYLKKNTFSLLTILILLFSTFSTGARSIILGCIITIVSIMYVNRIKTSYIILFCIFSFIIYLGLSSYVNEVIASFIDSESVNGSNKDMRTIQFEIAYLYFNKSIWYGNGISYVWETVLPFNEEILGAESLWIPIMIDQGIGGLLAYIIYFTSLIWFCLKNKSIEYIFIVLGFLVTNSLSSLPNFPITYITIYLFVLVKMKSLTTMPTNSQEY